MQNHLDLTIEKLVGGGAGFAHHEGKAVFVPFVLPGERVEAAIVQSKSQFDQADLCRVLEPSPHRVAPVCPLFGQCGGCQWLHIDYGEQIRIKRGILEETLSRVGRLNVPHIRVAPADRPLGYRTACRLHVNDRGQPGYYRFRTQSVVPLATCPLHHPSVDQVAAEAARIALPGVKTLVVKCGDRGETLLNATSPDLVEPPAGLLDVPADGLFFNHRHVKGMKSVSREVRGIRFSVSPGSFFQVHCDMVHTLNEEVRRKVVEIAPETLIDLYGGTGVMGLTLADLAGQVVGVEVDKYASADAEAASLANGIVNFRQIEATAQAGLEILGRQRCKPSLVLLDPPRRGCESKVLKELTRLRPPDVIYISCNPATLARDLAVLAAKRWEIQDVLLLDLFPQTFHIESMIHLRRN